MIRIYMSSKEDDDLSYVTICGKDGLHCLSLAVMYFEIHGFKGRPVRIVI